MKSFERVVRDYGNVIIKASGYEDNEYSFTLYHVEEVCYDVLSTGDTISYNKYVKSYKSLRWAEKFIERSYGLN